MPQNRISMAISDELGTRLADLLGQVEAALDGKTVTMTADERRGGLKMGDKSEAFVRQAMRLLTANRQVVPPSFNLDEAERDLAALDALRPLLMRVQRLHERLRDTELALCADLMSAGVEGYALLRVVGGQQGLDGLVKELGARFRFRRNDGPAPAQA